MHQAPEALLQILDRPLRQSVPDEKGTSTFVHGPPDICLHHVPEVKTLGPSILHVGHVIQNGLREFVPVD